MDIEHLGYKTIDLLLEKGLISDPADIFTFDPQKLSSEEGWGETSIRNLADAITEAKDRPLERLITALGIRHVGSTVARRLVRAFPSLKALLNASPEEIAAVEGVGPVIAESVREWADDLANIELVRKLTEAGVRVAEERTEETSDVLAGVTLVITGTLSRSREESQEAVELRGGRVTGSVSKSTTAVVVGDSPGLNKVSKARDLGIPMIDEAAFERLLDEGAEALG